MGGMLRRGLEGAYGWWLCFFLVMCLDHGWIRTVGDGGRRSGGRSCFFTFVAYNTRRGRGRRGAGHTIVKHV